MLRGRYSSACSIHAKPSSTPFSSYQFLYSFRPPLNCPAFLHFPTRTDSRTDPSSLHLLSPLPLPTPYRKTRGGGRGRRQILIASAAYGNHESPITKHESRSAKSFRCHSYKNGWGVGSNLSANILPYEVEFGGGRGGPEVLEEAAESGHEQEVEQRGGEGCEEGPGHHGVPGGGPEQLDGAPEIYVREGRNLRDAEGQVRRAEEFFAQAEEGDQKRDLQRVQEVIDQLDGGKIQAPHEGNQCAERGVAADGGKKADDRAERDAQRQFFRCRALAE